MNTKIFSRKDWLMVFGLAFIRLPFYFMEDLISRLLSLREPNCPLKNKNNPDVDRNQEMFLFDIGTQFSFSWDNEHQILILKRVNGGSGTVNVSFYAYPIIHPFWLRRTRPHECGSSRPECTHIYPSVCVYIWWMLKIFWFVLVNKEMDVYCYNMDLDCLSKGEEDADISIIIPVSGNGYVYDIHRHITVRFE